METARQAARRQGADMMEAKDGANGLAVDMYSVSEQASDRAFLWSAVWNNTRSIHEAIRLLFNAGYRGHELVPPAGWPARLH